MRNQPPATLYVGCGAGPMLEPSPNCAAPAAPRLPNATARVVIAAKRILRIFESSGLATVGLGFQGPCRRCSWPSPPSGLRQVLTVITLPPDELLRGGLGGTEIFQKGFVDFDPAILLD